MPEKPKVRMERWQSNESNEEVHYFISGTQVYIAGFNPMLVREDDVKTLLRMSGFDI